MQYRMYGGLYDRILLCQEGQGTLRTRRITIKIEGMYAVGGVDGLYLRIRNQSCAWALCVAMGTRINNPSVEQFQDALNMGLGPYPEVSLAEARDKSAELRKQIGNGINPLQENTSKKPGRKYFGPEEKTLAECCEEVLEVKDR